MLPLQAEVYIPLCWGTRRSFSSCFFVLMLLFLCLLGSILPHRLGLDVGGGTGSFAAHMARFGVTVMTTAFNVETVRGKRAGLPYMETIALRGLIPLHVPHKVRASRSRTTDSPLSARSSCRPYSPRSALCRPEHCNLCLHCAASFSSKSHLQLPPAAAVSPAPV